MTRSATDVMQEIVFAAVIDAVMALKQASKGLPNSLLRDINAVHANTTLADLPPELQAAIAASVRGAFTRLLKEGYSVSGGQPQPPRSPAPVRRDARPARPAPRPPGSRPEGPRRPPRGGGRPGGGGGGGGKPGPRGG
jgi:hypothetical protein